MSSTEEAVDVRREWNEKARNRYAWLERSKNDMMMEYGIGTQFLGRKKNKFPISWWSIDNLHIFMSFVIQWGKWMNNAKILRIFEFSKLRNFLLILSHSLNIFADTCEKLRVQHSNIAITVTLVICNGLLLNRRILQFFLQILTQLQFY